MKNSFELAVSKLIGYDEKSNKYYVQLIMFQDKNEYVVDCQCDDYNVIQMEPENLTISFMNDRYDSVNIPYEREMFQEIEMMACQMFEDMKEEEQHVSGAV